MTCRVCGGESQPITTPEELLRLCQDAKERGFFETCLADGTWCICASPFEGATYAALTERPRKIELFHRDDGKAIAVMICF